MTQEIKTMSYDEVERLIEKTEPPQLSDRGDKIWTRRMAVALADLFNSKLRAPIQQNGGAVSVKALEWLSTEPPFFATSPFCSYRVSPVNDDTGPHWEVGISYIGSTYKRLDTDDEAKAAAQLDYEQRILSALTPAKLDIAAVPFGYVVTETTPHRSTFMWIEPDLSDVPGATYRAVYAHPTAVSAADAELATAPAEIERLKAAAAARPEPSLDWYWPADDTSSDACADGPWQIAENVDLRAGDILEYARGGVVEVRHYGFLPPADDADSDDNFEVDEPTEEMANAKMLAEVERRAALAKREGTS